MKFLKAWFLVICAVVSVHAQINDKQKSNIYYEGAQKSFNEQHYDDALLFIERIQDSLNINNATVLDMKIKTYVKLGRFHLAKKTLQTYEESYLGSVNDSLTNETLSYLVQIEKGIDSIHTEKRLLEEALDKAKRRFHKILNDFRWEICNRCMGSGQYAFPKSEYASKFSWFKQHNIECEVCQGDGKILSYSKNESILGMSQKKFIELYEKDILEQMKEKKKSKKSFLIERLYNICLKVIVNGIAVVNDMFSFGL